MTTVPCSGTCGVVSHVVGSTAAAACNGVGETPRQRVMRDFFRERAERNPPIPFEQRGAEWRPRKFIDGVAYYSLDEETRAHAARLASNSNQDAETAAFAAFVYLRQRGLCDSSPHLRETNGGRELDIHAVGFPEYPFDDVCVDALAEAERSLGG